MRSFTPFANLVMAATISSPLAAQISTPDSVALQEGDSVRLMSHVLTPGWHPGRVAGAFTSSGTCLGVTVAYPHSSSGDAVLMFGVIDTLEIKLPQTPPRDTSPLPTPTAGQDQRWRRLDVMALRVKHPDCRPSRGP